MREIDARKALPLAPVAGAFACAISVHHGYVVLDENTDPVFCKRAEPSASIARYESRGNDLVNMTLEEARTMLRDLAFDLSLVTEVNGETPMGVGQSPRAYSCVKPRNVFRLKVDHLQVVQ